ncbi:hypothetical protein ZIOFF_012718 [Zingiber officinale]|uniref:Uncharacterized protein n=1 Tax=Zingiber officinale TaxID=94328 RepID=A0A8J5M3L4_ZINOF|nr:hypothetical protein ZIOFF_012718 [Zingiber officinale]
MCKPKNKGGLRASAMETPKAPFGVPTTDVATLRELPPIGCVRDFGYELFSETGSASAETGEATDQEVRAAVLRRRQSQFPFSSSPPHYRDRQSCRNPDSKKMITSISSNLEELSLDSCLNHTL